METFYSLKSVSQKTGLSAQLIRTWESRYNAVTPPRRPNNRRVYSEEDLTRLVLLSNLVKDGHSIGLIANLPIQTLSSMRAKSTLEIHSSMTPKDWIHNALTLIENQDSNRFDKELVFLGENDSDEVILESYLTPLMQLVGEKWASNKLEIASEHIASSVVRTFLANRLRHYEPKKNAPVIICGILEDQLHEFGSLSIAVLSAAMGWKAIHFGSHIPLSELALTALQRRAAVVAISVCSNSKSTTSAKHILNLRQLLPHSIEIAVGGSGISNLAKSFRQTGIHLVTSLRDFKRFVLDVEDKTRSNSHD